MKLILLEGIAACLILLIPLWSALQTGLFIWYQCMRRKYRTESLKMG